MSRIICMLLFLSIVQLGLSQNKHFGFRTGYSLGVQKSYVDGFENREHNYYRIDEPVEKVAFSLGQGFLTSICYSNVFYKDILGYEIGCSFFKGNKMSTQHGSSEEDFLVIEKYSLDYISLDINAIFNIPFGDKASLFSKTGLLILYPYMQYMYYLQNMEYPDRPTYYQKWYYYPKEYLDIGINTELELELKLNDKYALSFGLFYRALAIIPDYGKITRTTMNSDIVYYNRKEFLDKIIESQPDMDQPEKAYRQSFSASSFGFFIGLHFL